MASARSRLRSAAASKQLLPSVGSASSGPALFCPGWPAGRVDGYARPNYSYASVFLSTPKERFMRRYKFTSESVTEGHPDKVCDQISDAILDGILEQDPAARVACETLVKTGMAIVAGEITTTAYVDMPGVVRSTIKDIGYTDAAMGFDYETCAVLTAIEKQSPDISRGVTEGEGLFKEQGAGDQGLMFGFATDETPELMPAPIHYAHRLARKLAELRKSKKLDWLRPDGKTQVTFEYEDHTPVRVSAIVVSTQHHPDVKHKTISDAIRSMLIEKVIPAKLIDKSTKIFVNPTGRFVVGGPYGDAGLTGRKIIVDTYGGMGRHGGGAFSGKDPTKVDRSACYYARYVAKNVVAAKLASRCEVQIAYAIGVAQPVGVNVNTFGTGRVADDVLENYIMQNFDMRPKALIEQLDLLKPIYRKTAAYGHFGRDEFSWEKTTRAAKMADDLLRPTAVAVPAAVGTNGSGKKAPAKKKNKKEARAEV
jgi:S-adenosylmethionine synthetase